MHKLLSIQLRKHLGIASRSDSKDLPAGSVKPTPENILSGWSAFLESIDQAYRQFDRDLALSHRSLSLSTEELQTMYQLQRKESLQRLEVLELLRRTARALLPDASSGRASDVEASDAKDLANLMERLIQEREKSKADLEAREAQYHKVLESVKDVIFQLDAEGRWTYLNGAWTELTGFQVKETLGRSFMEFIVPEFRELLQREFGNIAQCPGPRAPLETQCITANGGIRWVKVHVRSMNNGYANVYGTIADITEQKRNEAAMLQAQKLESLGVLAGGIAHDFNNLMVVALGKADLAARFLNPSDKAHKHIEQVQVAIGRAAELCHQLLAYSGKGKFKVEVIDLNALVSEMAHLLQVSIHKNVVLEYQLAGALPSVEADSSQIRQAVMNLVINASEAIGDRNGSIRIETGIGDMAKDPTFKTYFPQDSVGGQFVFLRVQDNGCGMDEEILKRIFDPFFTTKFTGRGLGLASILGIVRSHKGSLQVESRPNLGTTFCLYFPASCKPASDSTQVEKASRSVPSEGVILVVDDEPSVRKLISESLQTMGFTVLQAPNGKIGLTLFQENRDKLVAVFLDLSMPVMGGEETFKAIQEIQPGTPIILMSGYGELATQSLANLEGIEGLVGFFQKPFNLRKLGDLLQSVLVKVQNLTSG